MSKITIANLIKHSTKDGLIKAEAHLPIGKLYAVDLATRRTVKLFNTSHGVHHEKEGIDTYCPATGRWEFFPTEILEILELNGPGAEEEVHGAN